MAGLMGVRSWLYTQARVSDLDASVDWYGRVLGFSPVHEINLEGPPIEKELGVPGMRVRMVHGLIGGVLLELIQVQGAGEGCGTIAAPGRLAGMTLAVESVTDCYKTAQARGVACIGEPVEFPPYASLTVYDPDGVPIDLTDFRAAEIEPGTRGGDLGVRSWLYTLVRVSEMERSIRWYEEMFGFAVVAELHLEGAPIEQSTGTPGIKVRMVQGDIGGVQIELIETQRAEGIAGGAGSACRESWAVSPSLSKMCFGASTLPGAKTFHVRRTGRWPIRRPRTTP